MRSQARTLNQTKANVSPLKLKDLAPKKEQIYFTIGIVGLFFCSLIFVIICYKAFASLLA